MGRFFKPFDVHNVAKRLLVSCTSFLLRGYVGMPYSVSQCSKKCFAMCIDFALDVNIARFDSKKRSTMMEMYLLCSVVSKNGPRIFTAKNSSGPAGCWKELQFALMAVC